VLILDEPTESLTRAEAERLFEQIRRITASGTAVVYISHRLPEVQQVADRITVLRDGEVRGTVAAQSASEDEILRLIIGRAVERAFPAKATSLPEEPALRIAALSGPRFHEVSVDVRPGEIVGLAGVEGNGQREFLRALAGLLPRVGELSLRGRKVPPASSRQAKRFGIVHLPGDRHAEGLFLPLSVRENTSILALSSVARAGFIDRGRDALLAEGEVKRLAVRTPSVETPIASLSGGNQQKVLFARSLLAGPQVLLADEPTHGVDAGARLELYRLLRATAAEGKAVVVLSTDVIELQGLCDRVLVFSRGEVVRELEGDAISEENITGAAITSERRRDSLAVRARRALRIRRFAAGDYLPTVVLALLVVGLGGYTTGRNSLFFGQFNFQTMLLLASALALVALGQLIVLLTGAIDLSVGPLTGLVVVVFSFFAGQGQGGDRLALGLLAVFGVAILVGVTNAVLVRVFRLAPVLATLCTYIIIQGVSLLLRSQPGGIIRFGVVKQLKTSWGWVPVAFIAVCALTVCAELVLRFTRYGLMLRAVGSDETRAHRLGARVNLIHFSAYVLCSLFAAAAGLMLASQVGIGDPRVGVNYTLTSITAVVLGGASIFGGRGSFIGALFGAILIQEIITATTFLQIGLAWQYYLPGILILAGAGIYSRARRSRSLSVSGQPA
jgi:ribose transport system ATP-binding protein